MNEKGPTHIRARSGITCPHSHTTASGAGRGRRGGCHSQMMCVFSLEAPELNLNERGGKSYVKYIYMHMYSFFDVWGELSKLPLTS